MLLSIEFPVVASPTELSCGGLPNEEFYLTGTKLFLWSSSIQHVCNVLILGRLASGGRDSSHSLSSISNSSSSPAALYLLRGFSWFFYGFPPRFCFLASQQLKLLGWDCFILRHNAFSQAFRTLQLTELFQIQPPSFISEQIVMYHFSCSSTSMPSWKSPWADCDVAEPVALSREKATLPSTVSTLLATQSSYSLILCYSRTLELVWKLTIYRQWLPLTSHFLYSGYHLQRRPTLTDWLRIHTIMVTSR